jgi:pimeloyl-ACP methyl ester carboxylesterase
MGPHELGTDLVINKYGETMIFQPKADLSLANNRARAGRGPWRAAAGGCLSAAILACLVTPLAVQGQPSHSPALKRTYVPLAEGHETGANALLIEPAKLGPKARIVMINTHPKNRNNFEYWTADVFGGRGYRVIQINNYDEEKNFEVLLPPIAAAIRYARKLPGVEKVVLVGHSGGGPELSYYQEIAEKGPSACQQPNRLYPCEGKGLTDLPKADALLLLEANIGAPHRFMSLDPAVDTRQPKARNLVFDMYAPQNGFDPKTNTASYSAEFLKRYWAGMRARSDSLIADAQARLKAIEAHTGPYNDDEPFIVAGLAEAASGARLNLADPKLLSRTHGPHRVLKADGTMPVEIVQYKRAPRATLPRQRDTLSSTAQDKTVRHFLSFTSVRTTPEFEITANDVKGIDWSSSANSAAGNVENISVPTLVMAGNCMFHLVPLEIVYDHSAAKDKEFVAVDGGDHYFKPCRPEFGDTEKRAYDYVEAWLAKRF